MKISEGFFIRCGARVAKGNGLQIRKNREFESHPHLQSFGDTARCGLGSHKPEEMVRVHLAPPKKMLTFVLAMLILKLTRDEAIASISLLIENLAFVLAYAMMDWKQR